jgi:WD40 repeat protein
MSNIYEEKSLSIKNLPEAKLLKYTTDVSMGGKYIIAPEEDRRCVKVYNYQSKKGMAKVDWHKGKIETVAFDKNNRYFATGGEDGRSYVWSIYTGKISATLAPLGDFVTCLEFNASGSMIACGSYNRRIVVTNVNDLKSSKQMITSHRGRIEFLRFMPGQRLVSFDANGGILLWDVEQGKKIKTLDGVLDRPTSVFFFDDFNRMIVTDRLGKAYLYEDMRDSCEQVSNELFSVPEGILEAICLPEKSLVAVSTPKGQIALFDLAKGERDLKAAIDVKDYESAHKIIYENPHIKDSKETKRLDKIWDKTYHAAVAFMFTNDKEKARSVLNPFKPVPSKLRLINALFKDFSEFQKFDNAYRKKNYTLSYGIAEKSEILKTSPQYEKMEKIWEASLEQARDIVSSDKTTSFDEKLKVLFAPYRGISSKMKMIQSFMQSKDAVRLFSRKLADKRYKEAYELGEKYTIIQEFSGYKQLIAIGERLKKQAFDEFENGDILKAKSYATQLSIFPEHQELAENLINHSNIVEKFKRYHQEAEYSKMLALCFEYTFLEESEIYKEFSQKWLAALKEAEIYAYKGNIKGILSALKEYVHINALEKRIVSILGSAYMQQLNYLLRATKGDKVRLKQSINRYIELFGKDDNIDAFIVYLEDRAEITFEEGAISDKRADYHSWHDLELPGKII